VKTSLWNEGLNHLDSDLVEEYVTQKDVYTKKKKNKKPYWFAAVAAVLVLSIGIGILPHLREATVQTTNPIVQGSGPAAIPDPSGIQLPDTLLLANLVSSPAYPALVQKPNYDDYSSDLNAYTVASQAWHNSQKQQYDQPDGYADSLTDFFYISMAQFLQGDGNTAYSPLNVYMAMAMLAETAGGNSRQQILDLFGVDTIAQLREQASHVWNAHYSNDSETTLLMANSIWLDDCFSFHQNTTDLLSQHYFASAFHGDLGTDNMDKQLQTWLDANTGGLLKDQAQDIKLDPYTVFALASTVYFSAGWDDAFSTGNTKDAIFHCEDKDLLTPFMNQAFSRHSYYWSENFSAISLEPTGDNSMWLILPNNGYTVEDILESDDYLRMTMDPGSWENQREYTIHLSLPKFDVVSQYDMIEGMKKLGITDIFDSDISDFTPMTNTPNLYVGQINHAARVAIDEDGCIASAFTVIANYASGAPAVIEEIGFILDQPFLFIISSRDNLPLFAGVVKEP